MKKNIFSVHRVFGRRLHLRRYSGTLRNIAGFSLSGIWQGNSTALLLVVVVLVVVIFIWLIFRRRNDNFPEIKPDAELPKPDKSMTMLESLTDNELRSSPSPGIFGKIEVFIGSQPGSTYLVTDNPLTIGRDPAQALAIIQEAIVSKLHCSIFYRDGKIFIKDLNSTNGTYVNKEKISEQELNENDIIFLGKKGTVKLVFHK